MVYSYLHNIEVRPRKGPLNPSVFTKLDNTINGPVALSIRKNIILINCLMDVLHAKINLLTLACNRTLDNSMGQATIAFRTPPQQPAKKT